MSKMICMLLAVLTLLSFLTGCGAPQDKNTVSDKSTGTSVSTTSAVNTATKADIVETTDMESTAPKASSIKYKDGVYEYKTDRDMEGYYVKATVTVKEGEIVGTDWVIYDANRNDMIFDDKYEEVFSGFEEYQQQCRDNLKGMKEFVPNLLKYQDINKVDCISGATWSHNKFQIAVKMALLEAKK